MDLQRLSLLYLNGGIRVRAPHSSTVTIGMVLCSFLWSGGDPLLPRLPQLGAKPIPQDIRSGVLGAALL